MKRPTWTWIERRLSNLSAWSLAVVLVAGFAAPPAQAAMVPVAVRTQTAVSTLGLLARGIVGTSVQVTVYLGCRLVVRDAQRCLDLADLAGRRASGREVDDAATARNRTKSRKGAIDLRAES